MKEATSFLNLSSIDANVGFDIDDFYYHEYDEDDFDDEVDFEFILRTEYLSEKYTEDTIYPEETMTVVENNDFTSRPVYRIRAE